MEIVKETIQTGGTTMEKFRAKVQKRVTMMSMIILATAAAYSLLLSGIMELPSVPDFIRGFNTGAFAGIELVMVFFTVKYLVSLKNDTLLKKLFIEEHDERTKMIMEKTGNIGMTLITIVFAIATIISGFFSQTIFFTLLAATVLISLVRGACKLFYFFKM